MVACWSATVTLEAVVVLVGASVSDCNGTCTAGWESI